MGPGAVAYVRTVGERVSGRDCRTTNTRSVGANLLNSIRLDSIRFDGEPNQCARGSARSARKSCVAARSWGQRGRAHAADPLMAGSRAAQPERARGGGRASV